MNDREALELGQMWLSIPLDPCGTCGGAGLIDFERDEYGEQIGPQEPFCPPCRGRGFVYPLSLVEIIGTVTTDSRWAHIESPLLLEFALAVFDALNDTETP